MTRPIDPELRRICVECGDCPDAWNKKLLEFSIRPEPPERRDDISETTFRYPSGDQIALEDTAGWQWKRGTEQPRGLAKVAGEWSGLESAPTARWKRSQEFTGIMTWIFAIKNRRSKRERDELMKTVGDFVPNEPLPLFDPALWGSPEEFFERWKGHLVDVRFTYTNRRLQRFELWAESFPPYDEDDLEDLGDAGEPDGHWDGLTWTPTPTKN